MTASANRLMGTVAVPFECPHCGVLTQHNRVAFTQGHTAAVKLHALVESSTAPAPTGSWEYTANVFHDVVRCVNCGKDTYFLVRSKTDAISSAAPPPFPPAAHQALARLPQHEVVHQYPLSIPTSHPAVPVSVASAAIEAEKCLGVGAFNACGVMTRRAIHSLCEDKKAEGKDLFAQLKDLKAKQLITPDLHEWADTLRVLGRDGAHPEFPEVTPEDAEDGVKLLREIVKYVYILPHERAEKRRSK